MTYSMYKFLDNVNECLIDYLSADAIWFGFFFDSIFVKSAESLNFLRSVFYEKLYSDFSDSEIKFA